MRSSSNGVDGEPGIPLDDLARSITKLPYYEAARKRVGPKEAIRAMAKYSYLDFKGFARRDDPWVTVTAAEVDRQARWCCAGREGCSATCKVRSPQASPRGTFRV